MTQVPTSNTGMGCFRWIRRLLIGSVLVIGLALITGVIYQQSAMARDRATYVPSENLVEVDGVEMYIECEGEGSPTVVFESGAGTPYFNWLEMRDAIVQDTRTCVYDRQGIGWSGYTGEAATATKVAQTLHTLLENAGESAPYVLVGHSLGGFYVREYAYQYPEDVVGMVLIDASHEQQLARFPEAYREIASQPSPIMTFCKIAAPTGVLRIFNVGSMFTFYTEDSPLWAEDIAIFNQSHYCAGIDDDMAGIMNMDSSVSPQSLGDIPLAVLTAGVQDLDEVTPEDLESLPEGITLEMLQEVDQLWFELQEELAGLSSNSTWQVVEGASHYIHLDEPQVVIDAIRDVLEQATTE